MKKFKVHVAVLIVMSSFLLEGCATVPPGSAIIQEQAIRMVPPEGWGAIYVFRPSMPPGDMLWGVNLDSKHFGYLAPKSYLYGVLQPGRHTLDLEYPGSTIEFEVNNGDNNYFKIVPGFPGVVLATLYANEARRLLDEYTLSALNVFENDEIRQMLRSDQAKE